MPLVASRYTPCPVPADLDGDAYYRVGLAASALSSSPPWQSYASAFNGVAFRLAAAEESHDRFVAAISGDDAFTPSGPRYVQEESLFAFFVNALSTVECMYFALYNLAACLHPGAFPATTGEHLREVNIAETARRFKNTFPTKPITKLLREIRDSKELKALTTHRDFLTHRGAPPRRMDLGYVPRGGVVDVGSARSATVPSNPKDAPASWTSDLSLTPRMTAEPREWLLGATNRLLRGAGDFLGAAPV